MNAGTSPESYELLEYQLHSLRTVTEITKIIYSILELETLLNTTIDSIRDYFCFYHICIYLLDDNKQWASIRAGTGEAGRLLLEKEYKVEVNNTTLIGTCIQNRVPYVVVDGASPISFRIPVIPDTTYAIALPLISQDKVIGALEIQHYHYVEDETLLVNDLPALQIIADHLAIAIDNSYRFGKCRGD